MAQAKWQIRLSPTYWDDYADRCPVDNDATDMCHELLRSRTGVLVECDERQLGYLKSDAAFYAEGNVDDAPQIVRAAKSALAAIARATA